MTEASYSIQFPIGNDAATIIQDETAWPPERLRTERGLAEARPARLKALGDIATDADKEYAGQSTRITKLVNDELQRRGVKLGGRRRKARSTKGRKTKARRRRHTRRY